MIADFLDENELILLLITQFAYGYCRPVIYIFIDLLIYLLAILYCYLIYVICIILSLVGL